MRTKKRNYGVVFFSSKTDSIELVYYEESKELHILEGQNLNKFRVLNPVTESQAKTVAWKVITAYERAFTVAQIIEPE